MSFMSQCSPPSGPAAALLPGAANSITSQLCVTTSAAGKPMLAPVTEVLSFDTGFFMALKAVQLLREHQVAGPDGVAPLVVVALGGPSGAGKTVFAEKLGNMLPGSALISMDCYNDGSKCIDDNFDDERLTDYDTLLANLVELRAGRSAEVPIYCYKASRRIGFRTVAPPTSRVLLLEGIYALSGTLRPHVDLRIAITGGVHKDLIKRVLRDVTRTKQSPREIIQQISETVYPMYKAYIEPDLQTAQLRIRNEWNPFTGLVQQPTYTMKQALPLSSWATGDAAAAVSGGDVNADVARIAGTLGCAVPPPSAWSTTVDTYLLPPHEQAPTCATWLRLRACDGRYFLIFDEFLSDGPFVISPGVRYEVGIRVLGGLMALGYTIGCTLRRRTISFDEDNCGTVVKIDIIHSSETDGTGSGSGGSNGAAAAPVAACFVQVQGRLRAAVEETARRMGMDADKCIPMSYIQQVQQHQLAGVQLRDNSSSGSGSGNGNAGAIAHAPATPPLHGRPDWLGMAEAMQSPAAHDIGAGAAPVARVAALCARVDALATQAAAKHVQLGASHGVVSAAPAGSLEALMQAQTALALEVGRLRSGQGHMAQLTVVAAALGAGVLLGATLVRAAKG